MLSHSLCTFPHPQKNKPYPSFCTLKLVLSSHPSHAANKNKLADLVIIGSLSIKEKKHRNNEILHVIVRLTDIALLCVSE